MDKKALSSVEIKNADEGRVTAVFSTFDVVDHDGDITVKGAIKDGTAVRISAYNHGSWQGALPVGKGVIRNVGNQAVLEGQFFMNTTHGRDTFEVVKQLGDQQQWSYGFDVVQSDDPGDEAKSGGAKRILKELNVHEVSPVMIGAGVGTRTVAVKAKHMMSECEDTECEEHPTEDEDEMERRRERRRRGKSKRFTEEGAEVLASVKSFRERAADVMAMRAQKGQQLGEESSNLLTEIHEELEKLEQMLKPAPEGKQDNNAQREWLRSIANNL